MDDKRAYWVSSKWSKELVLAPNIEAAIRMYVKAHRDVASTDPSVVRVTEAVEIGEVDLP